MADLYFTPLTGYDDPRWATARLTLEGTGTLDANYTATTNTVNVVGWSWVVLSFTYTTGNETTIQVKPQGYNGTDWVDLCYKATQGSGVSELTKDAIQITKANFTTGDKFGGPQVLVRGFHALRCMRKGVSGSTFGTLLIYANGTSISN